MIRDDITFNDLSARQFQVFSIIYDYYKRTGFYPTYREVAEIDGSRRGNVQQLINALKRKGYLELKGIEIKKDLFKV